MQPDVGKEWGDSVMRCEGLQFLGAKGTADDSSSFLKVKAGQLHLKNGAICSTGYRRFPLASSRVTIHPRTGSKTPAGL